MSRQNKAMRTSAIARQVTEQHKKGNKFTTPAPKHGKKRRLAGSTNYRGSL